MPKGKAQADAKAQHTCEYVSILRRFQMPFWQRLLYTTIVIVVTSFVAGLIWHRLFGFGLPSYVGGVIGGLTALPFWELLKRKGSKEN